MTLNTAHYCGEGSGICIHLVASIKSYIHNLCRNCCKSGVTKQTIYQLSSLCGLVLFSSQSHLDTLSWLPASVNPEVYIKIQTLLFFGKRKRPDSIGPIVLQGQLARAGLVAPSVCTCALKVNRSSTSFSLLSSNTSIHVHHQENLVRIHILMQKVQGGA